MKPTVKYLLIIFGIAATATALYLFFFNKAEAAADFPLKYGDTGPNVSALQKFLNQSNSSYALKVNGIFDDATEQAVLAELPSQKDAGPGQVGWNYFNVFILENY